MQCCACAREGAQRGKEEGGTSCPVRKRLTVVSLAAATATTVAISTASSVHRSILTFSLFLSFSRFDYAYGSLCRCAYVRMCVSLCLRFLRLRLYRCRLFVVEKYASSNGHGCAKFCDMYSFFSIDIKRSCNLLDECSLAA